MRTGILRVVMTALAMVLATFAVPAHATPTELTPAVSYEGNTLTITGTLTSGGAPVANAPLQVIVDDSKEIATGKTDGNGAYKIVADISGLPGGDRKLVVRFPGQGNAEAVDWGAVLKVQAGGPTLTAQGPATASNGQAIDITGALTDASGKGIGSAGIKVIYNGKDVADSYTTTGADGKYNTAFEVPEEHGDGDLSLKLSFEGNGTHPAVSTELKVKVNHLDVLPSEPVTSFDTASPPASSAPASQSPSASASQSKDGATATPNAGSSLPWIALGVAGTGVVIMGAALALYLRKRRNSLPVRGADEDDSESTGSWLIGKPEDRSPASSASPSRATRAVIDVESLTDTDGSGTAVLLPNEPTPTPQPMPSSRPAGDDTLFRRDSPTRIEPSTALPSTDKPAARPSRAAPDHDDPTPPRPARPGRAAPPDAPLHGSLERDDFDPPPSSSPRPRRGM